MTPIPTAQPKQTPASGSRQALLFGIIDRLLDHKHCVPNLVMAPADEAGKPDWERADPANVEALPDDEWPQDERTQKRAAVLIDHIDGCDAATSMLLFLREDGQPSMEQIAGPDADADIAMRIVGRDIGAKPPERTMVPLEQQISSLSADLNRPKPAPVAANDNKPSAAPASPKPYVIAPASDLLEKDFPPVKYIVPSMITEGLTILGGRPKLGKSWLAANICLGVATGGSVLGQDCPEGDAIYLALEDNERRLKDRLLKLMPPMKSLRPDISRLAYGTEAPRMNAGLIEYLDQWRTCVEDPRLIVIDTLAMVRPPKGRNQGDYEADYAALSPLQKYAGEHRLGIIVVTHVRKAEASDPLEMISGTNGLTGAADSIMVLNRDADGSKLYGRGRDIEEVEKAIRFDGGRWSLLGDVDDVKRSDQRRAILAALAEQELPMKPGEIAAASRLKVDGVRHLLPKMVTAGEVEKLAYGTYRLSKGE